MGRNGPGLPCRYALSKGIPIVSIILLSCVVFGKTACAGEGIADKIRDKLQAVQSGGELSVCGENIHADGDLIKFYEERAFAPFWLNERGLNDLGGELPVHLADSRLQGLDPEDYHLKSINLAIEGLNSDQAGQGQPDIVKMADLDILMTDAFMVLASNLSVGRVDPEKLYPLWFSQKERTDILAGLDRLERSRDLEEAIRSFAPQHEQYWRLVDAAREMERVIDAGGWPALPDGGYLRPGDRNQQVSLLRRRLLISGELKRRKSSADPELYDAVLATAVRKFQRFHGLEPDGIVGPDTRTELNMTAEQRRDQILLNLERWRWIRHRWTDNYIIVNAAAFLLTAHSGDEKITMRVIVGKDLKRTPVFSRKLRYIEINPYWNVPRSIAVEELLPKIQKDPGFVSRNDFEILSGDEEIDSRQVDWDTVTADNFPWRIRQKPGDKNALGHIKFLFPNRFDVYMHDTPDRDLFRLARRDLSHGCIRLRKPVELALFILKEDDPSWTGEKLQESIESGKRRIIRIKKSWAVHFLYWTAWVNDRGQLQFSRDIYNRDKVLRDALNTKPGQPDVVILSGN